jgi:hypothetical protein
MVENINNLMVGLNVVMQPYNLMIIAVGLILGIIVGVLPGLGGANGVAILIPVVVTMPPTAGIILLSMIYWGALYGGSITSILFNIPGEPWAVAATFDGYPMAKGGRPGKALVLSFLSHGVGALFGCVVLTFFHPSSWVRPEVRAGRGLCGHDADLQRSWVGRKITAQDGGGHLFGLSGLGGMDIVSGRLRVTCRTVD